MSRLIVRVGVVVLLLALPARAAEVCVYAASGYLATGTQNCVKNPNHTQDSEGYTTLDCTGAQVATFETYIPSGPASTFTAMAYVYSDDTGAGEVCTAAVGLISYVGHCLSTTPATNDGTVCQADTDCPGTPGQRTCRGGVLDNASLITDVGTTSVTRTFAADTRYPTTSSSATNIQRWGDDGASAWNAHNVDCGAGTCTGHVGRVYAILNTTGTTASDCQWESICIDTP